MVQPAREEGRPAGLAARLLDVMSWWAPLPERSSALGKCDDGLQQAPQDMVAADESDGALEQDDVVTGQSAGGGKTRPDGPRPSGK